MKNRKITLGWFLRNAFLWFIVFIMLFPLLHMISVSLSDNLSVMQSKVVFLPKNFTLDVYKHVLSQKMIYTAYKNTLLYVIVGTVASLFVLVTGSYALSKKRCPLGKQLNILILITMFFSGGMIPAYLAIKWLNMLDTIWAVTLPSALTAYNLIIMRSFFAQYPAEIEESGKLDGLNDIGVLWYLVLPTSTAVLATIGLFCAVGYWNSFFTPLIYLQNDSKYPLQIILRQ
ncbi:MAG: carbohydrate ABC transporter permease, partial [Clostridia bacterium]